MGPCEMSYDTLSHFGGTHECDVLTDKFDASQFFFTRYVHKK